MYNYLVAWSCVVVMWSNLFAGVQGHLSHALKLSKNAPQRFLCVVRQIEGESRSIAAFANASSNVELFHSIASHCASLHVLSMWKITLRRSRLCPFDSLWRHPTVSLHHVSFFVSCVECMILKIWRLHECLRLSGGSDVTPLIRYTSSVGGYSRGTAE